MNIVMLSIEQIHEAPWNPNKMDEILLSRLRESISRYGLVEPLVVRQIDSYYEVLSGNQRLKVLTDMRLDPIPCVIVNLSDGEAMLLAQVLNGLHGEDDLALKGGLLKNILLNIPEGEVLSLLPETADSLRSLASIGEDDMAEHLKAWEQAQAARLSHMQLQFTRQQLEMVEEAISRILPKTKDSSFNNPNHRGNAIYMLCKFYIERAQEE